MEEKVILSGKEYIVKDKIYYPVVKENNFEEMGGVYTMEKMSGGEEILIPMIKMPEMVDESKLNRFGKERLKYLKEQREADYQMMLLEGTLVKHLIDIQDRVEDFLNMEEPKMKESMGMTTQMQDQDFLKYAGLKKNLDMTLTRMAMEQIIWV